MERKNPFVMVSLGCQLDWIEDCLENSKERMTEQTSGFVCESVGRENRHVGRELRKEPLPCMWAASSKWNKKKLSIAFSA